MADDLVIRARVDPSGVTRGLAETARQIQALEPKLARASKGLEILPDRILPQSTVAIVGQRGTAIGAALTTGITGAIRDGRGRFVHAGDEIGDAVGSGAARAGDEAGRRFSRAFSSQLKTIGAAGDAMQGVGNRLSLTVTAPIVALGTLSTRLAADAAASAAKFEQVFGDATAATQANIDRLYATVYGTRAELQDYASDVGSIFRGLGAGAGDAARLSTSLVELAGDLAAFKNVSVDESLRALRAGLIGETEPLRAYGVVLSEARIQAEAAARGFAKTGEELTPLGRAYAAYSLILQSTVTQQGQAAREAGDAASTFRDNARAMREAATTIGAELVPQLVPLAQAMTGVLREVNQLSPATLQLGIKLAAVSAAVGPLLTGAGTLAIGLTGVTRAAAGLASAAGGIAGAAGFGGLARLVIPGGALLTGLASVAVLLRQIGEERRRLEGVNADFAIAAPTYDRSTLENIVANERFALERLRENRARVAADLKRRGFDIDVEKPSKLTAMFSPAVQQLIDFNAQIAATDERLRTAESTLKGLGTAATASIGAAADAGAGLRASFESLLAGLQGGLSLPKIDTKAAERALETFREQAEATVTRLNVAKGLGASTGEILTLTRDLGAAYGAVTAEIERQGGVLRANLGLLETQARLAQAMALGPQLRPLARVEIPQTPLPIGGLDPALVAKATAQASAAAAKARKQYGGLRLELEHIGDTVSAITQVADATGRIGDEARQALAGVGGLLSGIGRMSDELAKLPKGSGLGDLLKTAGGLSSVLTTIAGVGSIIGSMFGPSAREREDRAVLEQNTQRLRELADALNTYGNTLGNQTATLRSLGQIDLGEFQRRLSTLGAISVGDRTANQWAEVNRVLASVGLTFAEVNAIAKANGITLEQNGRVVAGAFGQLAPAIDAARAAALSLAQTVDAVTNRQSWLRDIEDIDTTSAAGLQRVLDDTAATFAKFSPELARVLFGGLDLTTAAGRAQADLNITELARQYLSDEFKAGRGALYEALKRSDFLSAEDFAALLAGADNALDGFAESVRNATAELTEFNVPPGFRATRNFLEYLATAPIGPVTRPDLAPPPQVPATPALPDRVSTLTPEQLAALGTVNDNRTVNVTVHVTSPVQSPRELAYQIRDVLRELDDDEARALGGRLAVEVR